MLVAPSSGGEFRLNLLKVSTGDSWVARSWDSVSKWTENTALAVLLKT